MTLPFITSDSLSPEVMEKRLVQEMPALSLQERDRLLKGIHGVSKIPQETPELIWESLGYLQACLGRKLHEGGPEAEAYRIAMERNLGYFLSRYFQLMFLRSELYDPVLVMVFGIVRSNESHVAPTLSGVMEDCD